MSGRKRESTRQRIVVKGLRTAAMVTAIAILGIGIMVPAAVADDGTRVYSNRSIQGKWGFGVDGHGVAVPDHAPAAAVGTATFDGMGGCATTLTINVNGTLIGPIPSQTCTYTVNPDGTGWAEIDYGVPELPGPIRGLFVIVDRGREMMIVNEDIFVAGYNAKRM